MLEKWVCVRVIEPPAGQARLAHPSPSLIVFAEPGDVVNFVRVKTSATATSVSSPSLPSFNEQLSTQKVSGRTLSDGVANKGST